MKFISETLEVRGVKVPFRSYIPEAAPKAYYQNNRPAIIVFPGGGYGMTYPGEAEPIALRYVAQGFCAFVLDYSCYPAHFPQALLEGLAAVRYVRSRAAEYGIDPHRVSVCGFSAGGHCAATVGTLWNNPCVDLSDGERRLSRPDGMVLCYPVLDNGHHGSLVNLVSGNEEELTPELYELFTLRNHVCKETPPTFLWHNSDDRGVPVEGTLLFGAELAKNEIPFEVRVYENGGHGTCLGNFITSELKPGESLQCDGWVEDSARFLLRH